jgi:MinD-like ATPase involved in chromosome partitioning or flagellar assembly
MLLTIFLKIIECGHLQWSKADIQKSTKQRIGMSDNSHGQELVATPRKEPFKLTGFGGHTDRVPTDGFRAKLYERGLNIGPTDAEVIRLERGGCKKCRQALRRTRGALNVGSFSNRGGDGKSTLATLFDQMFYDINPVTDRTVLIDINTSMTTLDVINGLSKEDFLTDKYWTMETLFKFIDGFDDIRDIKFDDIAAKLAYREDPQLPIIPLLLKPSRLGLEESKKLTGEQYLRVLRVLEMFFNVIIHDFGTDSDVELSRMAFSQLHMLAVLTHTGQATTQMVGRTLEMLHLNYYSLLKNTAVIFNLSTRPSRQALRAITLEKAGKTPNYQRLMERLGPEDKKKRAIQTPQQARAVINNIIDIDKLIDPLEPNDIIMVPFDDHLSDESRIQLDQVSEAVRARLWIALHHMLHTRVEFERNFWKLVPEDTVIRRDQMVVRIPDDPKKEDIYELVDLSSEAVRKPRQSTTA